MNDITELFHKAGYEYEVAEVLAECFQYDHPAVRIKAELQKEEKENGNVNRV